MKRILLKEVEQSVPSSELKNTDHVGFIYYNGFKGFVSQVGHGYYLEISMEGNANHSNLASLSQWESAREVIEDSRKSSIKEAFVFDTRKELFKWLSE